LAVQINSMHLFLVNFRKFINEKWTVFPKRKKLLLGD